MNMINTMKVNTISINGNTYTEGTNFDTISLKVKTDKDRVEFTKKSGVKTQRSIEKNDYMEIEADLIFIESAVNNDTLDNVVRMMKDIRRIDRETFYMKIVEDKATATYKTIEINNSVTSSINITWKNVDVYAEIQDAEYGDYVHVLLKVKAPIENVYFS